MGEVARDIKEFRINLWGYSRLCKVEVEAGTDF
jgi:hypothetical protein